MSTKVKVRKKVIDKSIDNEDQEYKIFNYFKKHTSMLIAVVSGAIAVITFLLNMTVYMNNINILNYWGIDATFVNITVSNKVYIVFAGVLFTITMIAQEIFLAFTYNRYSQIIINFRYSKIVERTSNKNRKNHAKSIRNLERRIKGITPNKQNMDKLREIQHKLQEQKDFNNELFENIKGIRNTRKAIKRSYLSPLMVSLGLCFVIKALCFTCFFVFVSFMEHRLIKSLLIALGATVVEVIFLSFLNRLDIRTTLKKKMNDPAFKANVDLEVKNYDLPIEKIFDFKIKKIFKDKAIVFASILVVVSVLFTFLSLGAFSGNFTYHPNKFYIVEEENNLYVVVYDDGENLYLKKAEIINDKEITIDTTIQKKVSAENVVLKNKEFNIVNKIE